MHSDSAFSYIRLKATFPPIRLRSHRPWREIRDCDGGGIIFGIFPRLVIASREGRAPSIPRISSIPHPRFDRGVKFRFSSSLSRLLRIFFPPRRQS